MKKIVCSLVLLATVFSIHAQTFFGTTTASASNGGTIDMFTPSTGSLSVVHTLENVDHNPGYTRLVQAANGMLYGVVINGGKNNGGSIFSWNALTATYTKLHDFDSAGGASPSGNLIQATDGKLYGMTSYGGSNNDGVIFSFDPASASYVKLKDLDNATAGANPLGSLIQASDGKLYGMTSKGGSGSGGVIFSFDPVTLAYVKLKEFNFTDGAYPYGSLLQAADGKLYGMTSITFEPGDAQGAGVIFSLDPASGTYIELMEFGYTNGSHPHGSLVQGNNGKLYGMTPGSGIFDSGEGTPGFGVIFSFDPATSGYVVEKNFDNTNGAYPFGDLLTANDGKLYGMTMQGGNSNNGVIFSFDPASTTYAKLTDLNDANGSQPSGSLLQAGDGKLYGLTDKGGAAYYHDGLTDGAGVIFALDLSTDTYNRLHDFSSNEGGNSFSANLVKATDGMLYGMTVGGGKYGAGTLFSLNPSTLVYKKLYDFDITNGAYPYGGLIQAADGKLYGMTFNGGTSNNGVVFSFDAGTSAYTKLKNLDSADGSLPYGNLIQATNKKLYGMTSAGGSNNVGVIFSFDPVSLAYTKMKDFDYAGGETPRGSLLQATNGKLYGITLNGGSMAGGGTLFLIDPVTAVYAVLWNFANASGANSVGTLVQASNGNLYGMTYGGGTNFNGVLFSFDPVAHMYFQQADFDTIGAGNPVGNLVEGSDSKLYGTTSKGGSANSGIIFSFDPLLSSLVKLKDYNSINIVNTSMEGSALIEVADAGPLPVTIITFSGKKTGSGNELLWNVGVEENVDYYEVQRSIDGQQFTDIYRVKANGSNNYNYADNISDPAPAVYYYRLKYVDRDAKSGFSTVIQLSNDFSENYITVSPNPFKDKLTITIQSPIATKASFLVKSMNGQLLIYQNKELIAGTNITNIDNTDKLPQGTYLLTIISKTQLQTIQIMKRD